MANLIIITYSILHVHHPPQDTLLVVMSQDPYHAVQREIQTSLQTASTLRASYLRIRSTAQDESEELVWARNEVRMDTAVLGLRTNSYGLLA